MSASVTSIQWGCTQIFMGGRQTIVMHNTCEDSLLAAPIILDLVILAELLQRIQARRSSHLILTLAKTGIA